MTTRHPALPLTTIVPQHHNKILGVTTRTTESRTHFKQASRLTSSEEDRALAVPPPAAADDITAKQAQPPHRRQCAQQQQAKHQARLRRQSRLTVVTVFEQQQHVKVLQPRFRKRVRAIQERQVALLHATTPSSQTVVSQSFARCEFSQWSSCGAEQKAIVLVLLRVSFRRTFFFALLSSTRSDFAIIRFFYAISFNCAI